MTLNMRIGEKESEGKGIWKTHQRFFFDRG